MLCCNIFLTFGANRGYLSPLLPYLSMENNRPSILPTEEQSPATREQRIEAESRGLLQRLRKGIRAKVLAAGLAIGGAAFTNDKADAGTILPAEVLHSADAVPGTTDDETVFLWEGGQLRVNNWEDLMNRDIYWIGFRSLDDTQADAALSVHGWTPAPDRIIGPNWKMLDGIKSHDLILDGRLETREDFLVAIGLDENGAPWNVLDKYLEGSEMYVGYSPIQGDPTNIDEAIAMTDGDVYKGQVPDHLDPLVGYVMRPTVHSPEPSTLGLLGTAGAVIGAAALRRRRRNGDKK